MALPGSVKRVIYCLFVEKLDVNAEIHYLDAPKDIRKKRVEKRNMEKDPSVYSFEVTNMMFNFMEPKFETPDQKELRNGLKVEVQEDDGMRYPFNFEVPIAL